MMKDHLLASKIDTFSWTVNRRQSESYTIVLDTLSGNEITYKAEMDS